MLGRYALLTLLAGCLAAPVQSTLPLHPFTYEQGFEGQFPPVKLWASNGSAPTINFLGATTEKACEGHKALKLDVTLGDGSYYYFGVPLHIPVAGSLQVSARLLVQPGTHARVRFGVDMAYPPTSHTGCDQLQPTSGAPGDWQTFKANLVQTGRQDADQVIAQYTVGASGEDVGIYVDRWALFITGGKPGERVVAYLDDIRFTGDIPNDKEYQQEIAAHWAVSQAPFQARVKQWQEELTAARKTANLGQVPAGANNMAAAIKAANGRASDILAGFARNSYGSPGQVAQLQTAIATVRYGPSVMQAVTAARAAGRPAIVYGRWPAVSAQRAPDSGVPLSSPLNAKVQCVACAGEYQSVSAVVCALQDLKGLLVKAASLSGPPGVIPASALDVKIVKWWYQGASSGIGYSPRKRLVPELLLKDDRLVRVDTKKQDDYLRSTAPDGKETYLICSNPDSSDLAHVRPIDAASLQPVDIAAGASREFWITIHVPDNARPGVYQSKLDFVCQKGTTSLPLQLTVLPFRLAAPRLTYSIYYRGHLTADGQPTIGSEGKSEQQYRAEMLDMKAHGVLYPTNYQGWDNKLLPRVLEIRKEVGLPTDAFYNLGYTITPPKDPSGLAAIQQQVRKWVKFLKPYGYQKVYFYGLDEARGKRLLSQKAAWKAVQEAGGYTFVACYKGTFEAMGGLLNTAVIAGPPDPREAVKWHSVGSQAFCYANPQVGVEDPGIYRRNFGLVLWKAGFNGAMDYAYQHGFGHIWDDFDNRTYRDHVFAYPTINGVVDTIEWAGFREGVDDVRYVTTLEQAIAAAPAAKAATARQAKQWLASLQPASADLDQVRQQVVRWIEKLRG